MFRRLARVPEAQPWSRPSLSFSDDEDRLRRAVGDVFESNRAIRGISTPLFLAAIGASTSLWQPA